MAKRKKRPSSQPCPCGSDSLLTDCCGPLLEGSQAAATAEELMRSRYTAYVLMHTEHLVRTWHPHYCPPDFAPDAAVQWQGLEIVQTIDGGPLDSIGLVEFVATHAAGELHERSRFARLDGRWVYVDAAQ